MLRIQYISKLKIPASRGFFLKLKNEILGEDYELSLVFADKKLATELHLKWKKKEGPANILSFPLDKLSGEMFIYPKEYRTKNSLGSLYIHGLVHLAGFTHGSAMDKEEKKWREKFGIKS